MVSIDDLYQEIAYPFRRLFQDSVKYINNYLDEQVKQQLAGGSNLADKKQKGRETELADHIDLVTNLLRLYKCAPKLAIWFTDNSAVDCTKALLNSVTSCLFYEDVILSGLAADVLLVLHSPAHNREWSASIVAHAAFWYTGSEILQTIAKATLDIRDDSTLIFLFGIMSQLLDARGQFLAAHPVSFVVSSYWPHFCYH